MMDVPFDQFYAQNSGLVHKVSRKIYNRLLAMGASVEYNDIVQEATVVMIKAHERFDPSLGFKFSTYYYRSTYNELNKFAESYEKDVNILGVMSMQGAVDDDGDMIDMESSIDGGHGSPEQMLEAKQLLRQIKRELSPLAYQMLQFMCDPPEDFLREWKIACKLGSVSSDEIHLNFVCDYMQKILPKTVSKAEIRLASAEIGALRRSL